VTRRRAGVISDEPYSPDQQLIRSYAATYALKEENLVAVLSEFGPLSKVGQEQLIRCLVLAFNRYLFAAKTKERVTPGEQRTRLDAIEKAAKSLLLKLHDPAVRMWLVTAEIIPASRDRVAVNTDLKKAGDCVDDAIRGLTDIHDRAKAAARAASKRLARGRGGTRRRPEAKGQLINDVIEIYSHVRVQHPNSGNRPGLGGPMLRFIYAVGELCGCRVREPHIRDVWRVWKSKKRES
jgi:hypothetical protein